MELLMVVVMVVVLLAKMVVEVQIPEGRDMVQVVPNPQVEQEDMLGMVMALQPIR